MSEKPPLPLKEALLSTMWEELPDGTLRGPYFGRTNTTAARPYFTENDLALLHPSLPAALRAQLQWMRDARYSFHMVDGSVIISQLRYLTQSSLFLAEVSPDTYHYAEELHALRRTAIPDLLSLTALPYMVKTAHPVGYVVPHAHATQDYVVTTAWLDTHFPGWKPRFEAAECLGLSGEALAAHVFTPEPQPSVDTDMTDVTFD